MSFPAGYILGYALAKHSQPPVNVALKNSEKNDSAKNDSAKFQLGLRAGDTFQLSGKRWRGQTFEVLNLTDTGIQFGSRKENGKIEPQMFLPYTEALNRIARKAQ